MSSIDGIQRRARDVEIIKDGNQAQKGAEPAARQEDAAKISVSTSPKTIKNQILALSSAVSSIRVASDAVGKIERVVKSVKGIVDQAEKEPVEHRKERLSTEADSLLKAIDVISETKTADGARPLKGEALKLVAEKQLGESLDLILPEVSSESLGLSGISFKDSIMQIRKKVDTALSYLNDVKSLLHDSEKSIGRVFVREEIARENHAASKVQVKDVETALFAGQRIAFEIEQDPSEALGAYSFTNKTSKFLLDTESK